MKVLVKTTDLVRISYLRYLLANSGIECHVFDTNISAIEGRIGAFPCRIMVKNEYYLAAQNTLKDEGQLYDG